MPYPDELFYSVLARRDARMNYPGYKGVLRELFGCENLLTSLEFPSHLGFLMRQLSEHHPSATFQGLEQLSLLPWYAPFLPVERSAQIRAAMLASGGRDCWNRAGISASRIESPSHLRYCPECLRADKVAGRTHYWRRLHQLAGIEVCPEHHVWLENGVKRSKRNYRYLLLGENLLDVPARPVSERDACLLSLSKLGSTLLSREWPVMDPAQLRKNYLVLLERAGYMNCRGGVRMTELLRDVRAFYPHGFLERMSCHKHHWLSHLVRSRASIQQPIRHLMLVNFLGVSLDELFAPLPMPLPKPLSVVHANLPCANHLCPEHGNPTSKFLREERSSMLKGVIEVYGRESCGQVQARCCAGRERTWVRDYGHLWRQKLKALWTGTKLSLRSIAKSLRVSCDSVRRNVVKAGLPLKRGWRTMSVQAYPHLLASRAEKRQRKLERIRKRWLAAKILHPDLGVRGLRDLMPAGYASLYRYDREWLKANQPPARKRKSKVDWNQRDAVMCQRLELVAEHSPGLTPNRLAQSVGVTGWIPDRLARLPMARKLWQELTEDVSRN